MTRAIGAAHGRTGERSTAVALDHHSRMPSGVPRGRHADDRTKGTS